MTQESTPLLPGKKKNRFFSCLSWLKESTKKGTRHRQGKMKKQNKGRTCNVRVVRCRYIPYPTTQDFRRAPGILPEIMRLHFTKKNGVRSRKTKDEKHRATSPCHEQHIENELGASINEHSPSYHINRRTNARDQTPEENEYMK